MLIFFQYPYMFTIGIKTVVLQKHLYRHSFPTGGSGRPKRYNRSTLDSTRSQCALSTSKTAAHCLFPVLFFTNLLFSTFNELHPNYFRHLLHALGMNIKVDDMKSNTQSTVVPFLPHLAAAFTSVLTVSSALLPRIILHSILCFAGFLQLVFLCSKSIPRRIINFCIGLLDLWNPWKYGAKRGGGWRGGGTGEGSWNYTYRTF